MAPMITTSKEWATEMKWKGRRQSKNVVQDTNYDPMLKTARTVELGPFTTPMPGIEDVVRRSRTIKKLRESERSKYAK